MTRVKERVRPQVALTTYGPRLFSAGAYATDWVGLGDHAQLDASIAFQRALVAGRVHASVQARDAGACEAVDVPVAWMPVKRKGATLPVLRATVACTAVGRGREVRIAFEIKGAPLIVGAALSVVPVQQEKAQ